MFGKKSRLERENDALEERIKQLDDENDRLSVDLIMVDRRWLRLLREYRYSQKANERRKRANKRLRAMLDDVGWPKNDKNPNFEEWKAERLRANESERLVPRKLP